MSDPSFKKQFVLMGQSRRKKGILLLFDITIQDIHFEENILNYFTNRISSGPVEGLNNKIKVIKRRGFGFRNIANFAKRLFLDINYKPILLPT